MMVVENVQEGSGSGKARTDGACHPAAELFPLLEDAAFWKLLEDIREHGVREPGWLDRDGRILDGRNRDFACRRLGIEMPWRTYEGAPGTEVDFIVSLNLHRRHLTSDQRAAIAVEVANLQRGDNQHTKVVPPNGGTTTSQAKAAKEMKVSTRQVQRAAKVKKEAPHLHAKVKAGEMKLADATKHVAKKESKLDTRKTAKPEPKERTSVPSPSPVADPKRGNMANVVIPQFLAAVAELETWAEEIEQRADELRAPDRQKALAALLRADTSLRELSKALAPTAA